MVIDWDKLVREFLDTLERKEVQLLSWGIVDGGFSEEEIEELAQEFFDNNDIDEDAWDLVELMLERRLIFDFNIRGRRLYRSRMAEAVRLFARLRQLFPSNNWQTAPTMVADYRLQITPRVYPRRHITLQTVIEYLQNDKQNDKVLTPIRQQAITAILDSPTSDNEILLADFQLRATSRMLRDLNSTKSRGMIVCAGTGTGKTLAFYLPALAHIAGLVKKDEYWSKGLAIYPRNELLKDQFSETYQQARRLDAVLGNDKRKIIIGAFFGLTPKSATLQDVQEKWESQSGGFTCPYLRCPKCDSALSWQRADLEAKREKLTCLNPDCRNIIHESEVILTRERMAKTPPDLVFTTTEMLNRSMSDSKYGHVFGIRAPKTPQIILLDEVHTYTGIHGAQVAYLLRRWQYIIQNKVHFTGLSATLESAAEFFSQLTGLNLGWIEEICPGNDLIAEGMEYQLALRGDPVSGTTLLSSSILTAVLLRRVLDPRVEPASKDFYGSRVFAFTDDLDVTNRLFHNLLDTEGLNSWGRPIRKRLPLAALRARSNAENKERLVYGQSWLMCEEIGHGLEIPLNIGRTSSQDTGVSLDADIIVATASLEVGFNDPDVGGVIQHKAPRDMASFLQRKGRAGRKRAMRPWTVIVLSDYGRDRIAYQNYDMLFSPVLEKRFLPIANRYVIRIQAVFAFMDWVATQLVDANKGSVWNDFAAPAFHDKTRQQREIDLIKNLLETGAKQRELELYLQTALNLTKEEVETILWEPPRSLMMAALPTLLRRLESGWKCYPLNPGDDAEKDYQVDFSPLPDFVTSNLFSDLLLPEVLITTPAQTKNSTPDMHIMPMVQALKTFSPGRASRRFGVQHIRVSHWIAPLNFEERIQSLPIKKYCAELEEVGIFQLRENGKILNIPTYRPWAINPTQIPADISITSNAYLQWHCQILPPTGTKLEIPKGSPWRQIITEISCFTHTQQSPIEVRRFAIASHATIRYQNGREFDTTIGFVDNNNNSAAVGFAVAVDGLVFRFRIPPFTYTGGSSRTAYFRDRIIKDAELFYFTNYFQREWLYQIYISMLTARALQEQISLQEAWEILKQCDIGREMAAVLENIFQTLDIEEILLEDGQPDEDRVVGRQKVHDKLLTLCNNVEIQSILNDLAPVLWLEPDEQWHQWAALRFKSTLGGAILEACRQLCPQFDIDDLILDIDSGASEDIEQEIQEIWITESTIGGGGVIEEIIARYAADPANFFRLATSALEPSDFEIVDSELTRLLELIDTNDEVNYAVADARAAEGYSELKQATDNLRRVLSEQRILVTHPVITAINARILRPGSTPQTDKLLLDLIHLWHQEEARLGIDIDARVFAYIASTNNNLDQALQHLGLLQPNPYWRFQVIYGLLWARGNTIRSRALSPYNPFVALPEPDREILLNVLQAKERIIMLDDIDWRQQIETAFSQGMSVLLMGRPEALQELKLAILQLVAEPIELGFLQVYPLIEGVQRYWQGFGVRLTVQEIVQ
ncbi:hypothetical protein DSM106972_014780 [Dulcicalothrix desertica PCC 7102]|uniref:DEAD/DEAH box helicase n=1 Tax=Dulcicalothrix desertica PCC 7102 TaxID=232991 RepID=A0A433VQC7_9CYAN|nr:protein DpdJ [Dulcicalothrix desertica]RUT08310.1 hypothetical protein DSM106972_014780 [Dulcicalothrix desertica PCC 7102]TWH40176.1 Distinct helicase family with a unique C-terminal domain including a metal-binding cysteine cluster [Dulcicalothrix desertica PCC 7102]